MSNIQQRKNPPKRILDPNLGQTSHNRAKNLFFVIFSSLVHQFSLKLHIIIIWNNVQLLAEVKSTQKIFWGPSLGQNRTQNQIFLHFLKLGLLVFLEIGQDDSLEQCLTTSTGRSHEKNFWGRVFAIFSSLHYSLSLILHKIAAWDNV